MHRCMSATVAMLVVAFVAVGALASAQSVTTDIKFPFVAAGKDMAAGKYTIGMTPAGSLRVSSTTGASIIMPVITTLGRHDKDPDAELVFDKIEGKLVLSEIWLPGKDGYLVSADSKPHEHVVAGGPTSPK